MVEIVVEIVVVQINGILEILVVKMVGWWW